MPRGANAKKERLRVEEQELDQQLKDAGFEETGGFSFEEKKNILAMLEESCRIAKEEANQRQQLLMKEEKLLNDALNQSFNSTEVGETKEEKAGKQNHEEVPTDTAEAGTVEEQNSKECGGSRSGSTTPDLFTTPVESPNNPSVTNSPVKLVSKPTVASHLSSPARSLVVKLTPIKHSQKLQEDMQLFSQDSAKLGVDADVIEGCIKSIEDSEEEEDDAVISSSYEDTPRSKLLQDSPFVKIQTSPKQMQFASSESFSTNLSPVAGLSDVKPRRSIHTYQSENTVTTSIVDSQQDNNDNRSFSQPVTTSIVDNRHDNNYNRSSSQPVTTSLVDSHHNNSDDRSSSQPSPSFLKHRQVSSHSVSDMNDSIVSPVIGKQRFASNLKLSVLKADNSSTRDTESLNLPTVTSPDLFTDVEVNSCEVLSSETPPSVVVSGKNCFISEPGISDFDNLLKKEEREIEPPSKDSGSQLENEKNSLLSSGKVTRRRALSGDKKPQFQGLDLSDSDGESNVPVQEKTKLSSPSGGKARQPIGIFSSCGNDVCLERRYPKKLNSKDFYFKNDGETKNGAYERIMNMINQYFLMLKQYQSTLTNKLSWGDPIRIDRRVQDSLDVSRVSRNQREEPLATNDVETYGRVTRNSHLRSQAATKDNAYSSEDSLPEMESASGSLLYERGTSRKRRGLEVNRSRKLVKLHHGEEPDSSLKVPNTNLDIINESDSEDFVLPLITRLAQSSSASQENSASGRMDFTGARNTRSRKFVSKVEESTTNFDIGDILANSQEREEVHVAEEVVRNKRNFDQTVRSIIEMDSKPSTSGLKRPNKQPRKTFNLLLESDEESQPTAVSNPSVQKAENSPKRTPSPPLKKDVASKDSEEEMIFDSPPKPKSLLERKKEALVFQNSFEDEMTTRKSSPKVVKDVSHHGDANDDIFDASTARRGKSKPIQIKPGPLRLQSKRGRGKGKKAAVKSCPMTDFISVESPSTSEMTTVVEADSSSAKDEVECPLCMKPFPLTVIEAHASNCCESSEGATSQPVESTVRERRKPQSFTISDSEEEIKSADIKRRRERTPPGFGRCVRCNAVFKEGSGLLAHVIECQKASTSSSIINSDENSPIPDSKQKSPFVRRSLLNDERISKSPAGQSRSIFDQLEGVRSIQNHEGDIIDPAYRNPTTAIAHVVNCVAVRPHGLSETLAKKYPYCNTYASRRAIRNLNRAIVCDRDVPGTIKVCRSPYDSRAPLVVNLYGQFYMGRSNDNNNGMIRRLLSKLRQESKGDCKVRETQNVNRGGIPTEEFDSHLLNGLESDTRANRAEWFKESLKYLLAVIFKENIKRIVFPYKIGCGLAGGNWEEDYWPVINSFNKVASSKYGVEVIIVKKTEPKDSDQALAMAESKRMSRNNSGISKFSSQR